MLVPYEIFGPRMTDNGMFFDVYYRETDAQQHGMSNRFVTYILENAQCNICRQALLSFEEHSSTLCVKSLNETRGEPDDDWLDYYIPPHIANEFLKELKRENPNIFEITPIVGLSGLFLGSPMLVEMGSMVSRLSEKPSDIDEVLKLVRETIR